MPQRTRRATSAWTIALCFAARVLAADDCAPVEWQPGDFEDRFKIATFTSHPESSRLSEVQGSSAPSIPSGDPVAISLAVDGRNITSGKVNCRYSANTKDMELNYYTCTVLSRKYGITTDTFFMLNPELEPNCSNIRANTDYCVSGCKWLSCLVFQRKLSANSTHLVVPQLSSQSGQLMDSADHPTMMRRASGPSFSAATPRHSSAATRSKNSSSLLKRYLSPAQNIAVTDVFAPTYS